MTDGQHQDHHEHQHHDGSQGHHEQHHDGPHHEHQNHDSQNHDQHSHEHQNHEQNHEHQHHEQNVEGQPMSEQAPEQQSPEEPVVARRRLGRGLGALLGGAGPTNEPMDDAVAAVQQTGEVKLQLREIPISSIRRNPNQPRKDFDTTAIKELANSIKEHGMLQPILVREFDGAYQIVAGERRWLACQQIGRETIVCRVVDVIDKIACEYAFEENLKRQDLSDLEKAQAFKDYMNLFDSTVEELAKQLSMSRSAVSNTMRLLDLPVPVKQMMQKGELTAGHARALLPLKPEQQIKMAEKIVKQGLTVRKTEEEVRKIVKPEAKELKIAEETDAAAADPHISSLESQLREMIGAKVDIKLSGKDVGKIIIHFSNNDEFEGILGRLRERMSNAA